MSRFGHEPNSKVKHALFYIIISHLERKFSGIPINKSADRGIIILIEKITDVH